MLKIYPQVTNLKNINANYQLPSNQVKSSGMALQNQTVPTRSKNISFGDDGFDSRRYNEVTDEWLKNIESLVKKGVILVEGKGPEDTFTKFIALVHLEFNNLKIPPSADKAEVKINSNKYVKAMTALYNDNGGKNIKNIGSLAKIYALNEKCGNVEKTIFEEVLGKCVGNWAEEWAPRSELSETVDLMVTTWKLLKAGLIKVKK